jgi:hypothetical protein
MARAHKPDFLIEYERWRDAGPPKCCHTCDHYDVGGKCMAFEMYPPLDFVNSAGQCTEWEQEIPF